MNPSSSPTRRGGVGRRKHSGPMLFERLEDRRLLASDWTNPLFHLDVNGDGKVVPLDVLSAINELNRRSVIAPDGTLPDRALHPDLPFWDVTCDGLLTSFDVLAIVNALNLDDDPPATLISLVQDTAITGTNQDGVTSQSALQGTSTDLLGIPTLSVSVDGGSAMTVTATETGEFSFDPDLPQDGSADGEHTVVITARDSLGNEGDTSFTFTLDTTGPIFSIDSPASDQSLTEGSLISVDVPLDPLGIPQVAYRFGTNAFLQIPLDEATGEFSATLSFEDVLDGPQLLEVAATDPVGNTTTQTISVTVFVGNSLPLRITEFTPLEGANEVGVTFRPQVVFSEPVDVSTLDSTNFFASVGDQQLEARIVPANDGSFAWLFFQEPLPSASIIQVTLDGSTIQAEATGRNLDADFDGEDGGLFSFEFATVSLAPLLGTSLTGRVVDPGPDLMPMTPDDFDPGPDGQPHTSDDQYLLPLQGVEVFLLGLDDQRMFTDSAGRFTFDAVPAGNVKVAIEGSTVSNPPTDYYFPEMVMDSFMDVGQVNYVMSGDEVLYLPRLANAILKEVDAQDTTLIQADELGAPNLSPEDRQHLQVEIRPNSLIGAGGEPMASGQVGISTVPPELVQDMLPPGVLQHSFDITVQAPGIELFSTPAQITVPNVFDASPGTQLNFLSFDHTTGRLVIEGTATVSADGMSVTSDPDTGITHPGWHGVTDVSTNVTGCGFSVHDRMVPPVPTMGVVKDGLDEEEEEKEKEDPDPLENQLVLNDAQEPFKFIFKNNAKRIDSTTGICSAINRRATPLIVKLDVEGPAGEFIKGMNSQTFGLLPEQDKEIPIEYLDLSERIRQLSQDVMYGVKLSIEAWKFGEPETLLVDQQYNYYRLLDVADGDHQDAIFDFADTTNDGPDRDDIPRGVVRSRPLDLRMPDEIVPEFTISDMSHFFAIDDGGFSFDPTESAEDLMATVNIQAPQRAGAGPPLVNNPPPLGSFSLRGDGEKLVLAIDDAALSETLRRLSLPNDAPEAIPGASAAERLLLDDPAERTAIVNQIDARLDSLLASFVTKGADGVFFTADDGGNVRGAAGATAIVTSAFSGFESTRDVGNRELGFAMSIDVDGQLLTELIGDPGSYNSAELGFRLAEALNEQRDGTVELYLDNMFSLADFDALGVQALVNAAAKTLLHEIGHEAGLFHTSTTFQGEIFGTVLEDLKADGPVLFDDPSLVGVEVVLKDATGQTVARTATDLFGDYSLTALEPGSHTVELDLESLAPDEWFASTPTAMVVDVNLGEITVVPEFGAYRKIPISGFKHDDKNGNGQLDDGEAPVLGWEITLRDAGGAAVESVNTNAAGQFEFEPRDPGEYFVSEELPAGFGTESGTSKLLDVVSGERVDNLQFLNFQLADIDGMVFDDLDGNGVLDAGETGMAGVTINLLKPDGTQDTDVSAADGTFSFTDLPPGTYGINQTFPAGHVQTFPLFGSYLVDVMSATDEMNVDFGNYLIPLPGMGEGIDFGDAPDSASTPRYPTLASSGGAGHAIVAGFQLGALIDGESDGQPNTDATGDATQIDDEDGVSFTSPLVPGQLASVQVIASAAGRLDAFVDFNGDDDWNDLGEKIFDDQPLTAGVNSLTFSVPPGATPNLTTYARFRFSSMGGLTPIGAAGDGEVEDYQVSLADAALDFGDAPDPTFPSLLSSNGARHLIVAGIHLGLGVDSELDAATNASATVDGMDDGIEFATPLIPGNQANIRVTPSVAGKLDGFVDFNGDGDWDDAGERIFDSLAVSAGENTPSFSVPLETVPGSEVAGRFRFSTAGGLDPTGGATDGEVEDYPLPIAAVEHDFGDADSQRYPTLLADDGPRHIIVDGIFLGQAVDAEPNAQPTEDATGDDTDAGGNDDDGIELLDLLVAGEPARLIATASVAGKLDAFLDFNGDGDFSDLGEQIFSNSPLDPGANLLTISVPTSARAGTGRLGRFRFSTQGGLSDTGLAANGEVEDYALAVLAPTSGPADEVGDRPAIAVPDVHANRDVMAQGLDVLGKLGFRTTASALTVALGLDWDGDAADAALGYYSSYFSTALQSGFFDFEPGQPVPTIDDGVLLVTDDVSVDLLREVDFGSVSVDGAAGESRIRDIVLRNTGDQPLIITGFGLTSDSSSAVSLTEIVTGTAIQPNETLAATLTFDPEASGEHNAELRIQHDGLGGTARVGIQGFGLSPSGDLRLHIENSNVGGAAVNAEAVMSMGFATLENIGASDLTITGISLLDGGPFRVMGLPFVVEPANPLVLSAGEAVDFDLVFRPMSPGLQRGELQIESDDPDTPLIRQGVVGTGTTAGAVNPGRFYFGVETPDVPASPVFHELTDPGGNFSFVMPPSTLVHYAAFEPVRGLLAEGFDVTRESGTDTVLPELLFQVDTSQDSDGDGLPDASEFAVGTASDNADTNGDGITDLLSIQLGLDPLSGLPPASGVVGIADLDADALQIVVASHPSDPARPLAYVSTERNRDIGLAIVDIQDPSNPVTLSQTQVGDTRGFGVGRGRMAVDPLSQLAVVDSFNGTHVVDISDPVNPVPLMTLNLDGARDYELYAGVLYATTRIGLLSFDPTDGRQLDSIAGINPNELAQFDIEREGRLLYVMDDQGWLQIVELDPAGSGQMIERGQVRVNNAGGRITVHNEIVYALVGPQTGIGGFTTIDVSDADNPTVITPLTFQALPKSDIAIHAADPLRAIIVGRNDANRLDQLSVLDVSDPSDTLNPVAAIELASTPGHVALGLGRAYLAHRADGLQIVNFLPMDTAEQRPAVTLSSAVQDVSPADGLQLPQRSLVSLLADASDDVGLRSVELLLDGQVVAADFAAPFQLEFVAPQSAGGGNTRTYVARATDLGGNSALSDPLEIELVAARPPRIVTMDPVDGGFRPPGPVEVHVRFDDRLEPATVNGATFAVQNLVGVRMDVDTVTLSEDGKEVTLSYSNLAPAEYRFVIDADQVTGVTGTPVGSDDMVSTIHVTGGTVHWVNPAGGAWHEASNWSTGTVPGPDDVVVIGVDGRIEVNLGRSADVTVEQLLTEEYINNPGNLTLNGRSELRGGLLMDVGHEFKLVANDQVTLGGNSLLERATIDGPGSVTNIGTVATTGFEGPGIIITGTFNNAGMFHHDRGSLEFQGSGEFNNLAAGIFQVRSVGGTFRGPGSQGGFHNVGTFVKLSRATSEWSAPLHITGDKFEIREGTLRLDNGGSFDNSQVRIEAKGTLELESGGYRYVGDNTAAGLGDLNMVRSDVTVEAGASAEFNLNGTSLEFGLASGFDLVVEGTLINRGNATWHGHNIVVAENGTIRNEGVFNIDGTAGRSLTGTLENRGTVNQVSSREIPLTDATINNRGTWVAQGQAAIRQVRNSVFNNFEVFRKTGEGTAKFDLPFNSVDRTIEVQRGELQLTRGGQLTNTVISIDDAIFDFAGGNHTLLGSFLATGDGLLEMTRGSVTIADDAAAMFDLPAAGWSVSFSPSSGALNVEGTLTNNSVLILDEGLINTTGQFNNVGTLNWTRSGRITGEGGLNNSGTLNLTEEGGGFSAILSGVINNSATINHSTGRPLNFSGGTINNQPGALYDIRQTGRFWFSDSGTNSFNNAGELRKSSGGSSDSLIRLINSNQVNVQAGALGFARLTSEGGSFAVSEEASLRLTGSAAHLLGGETTFTGAGTLSIETSNLGIPAGAITTLDLTGSGVELNNARLTVDGTLSNTGHAIWNGGNLDGAGEWLNFGTLELRTGAAKALGVSLNNRGIVVHLGNGNVALNGTITNQPSGEYSVEANSTSYTGNSSHFNNQGVFRRAVGTGALVFASQFSNSGSVEVSDGVTSFTNRSNAFTQIDGRLVLAGGTISGNRTIDIAAGVLEGGGTIEASLINGGTINVAGANVPGELTITRDFTQRDTGVIQLDIGGTDPGQFDRLVLNSAGNHTATLDGGLEVRLIDGFTPAVGQSFEVMTFDSVSGDFSVNIGLDLGGGLTLAKEFNPSNLTLAGMQALALAQPEKRDSRHPAVTQDVVRAALSSGIQYWTELGLSHEIELQLADVEIEVHDLPGQTLALAAADKILLDVDAAGHGWNSDLVWTAETAASETRRADERDDSTGSQVDLLSTIVHELGHLIGYEHHDADQWKFMAPTLGLGEQLVHATGVDDCSVAQCHTTPAAEETTIYLDFDGASGVEYDGPIRIEGIEVPAFSAESTGLGGQEGQIISRVVELLEQTFISSDVKFTTEPPVSGPHSTIYVGGWGSEFPGLGDYWGLAEKVDVGDQDPSDTAFVFSERFQPTVNSPAGYARAVATVVAHEAGHLLGTGHIHSDTDAGPLAELAFKPYTHMYAANDARSDAIDDGFVSLGDGQYRVDPTLVGALQREGSSWNAGAIGPDGFPDILFGQSVVHGENTGLWLTHVLEKAHEAQSDSRYSRVEKDRILAFAHGFLSHAAGDVWAHTLVNDFARGVFPNLFNLDVNKTKISNAARHLVIEGYIADVTPGFDANPDRTAVPGSADVSNDSTLSTPLDRPPNAWIFETFIDEKGTQPPNQYAPFQGFIILRDSLRSAITTDTPDILQNAFDSFDETRQAFDNVQQECSFPPNIIQCPIALAAMGITAVGDAFEAAVGVASDSVETAVIALRNAWFEAWADDIDEGLKAWGDLGLRISRGLFDHQAKRDLQNDECAQFGSESNSSRAFCEDNISTIPSTVVAQIDAVGDSWVNDHLIPMLGAPDIVGDLRGAFQEYNALIDSLLSPILATVSNISEALVGFNPLTVRAQIKDAALEFVLDLINDRLGFEFDDYPAAFNAPSTLIDDAALGSGPLEIPLFEGTEHAKLDEYLGIPAGHHTGPDGIPGDNVVFDPEVFAAYRNTVTMTKLLLLDGEELDRLIGDLVGHPFEFYGPQNGNVMTTALPGVVDARGERVTSLQWLNSIDSDHAWRSDGSPTGNRGGPAFNEPTGGFGNFPLWEDCQLRDKVFRGLFKDWENGAENFPDLGDGVSGCKTVVEVIDRSASLEDSLGAVINTASAFPALMQDGDRLGVASFADTAITHLQITTVVPQDLAQPGCGKPTRECASDRIRGLTSGGATSIGAGIQEADSELDRYPSLARAMILFSDGTNNTSPHPAEALHGVADDIQIFTIGYGPEADQALLAGIAQSRPGGFFKAEDEVDLMEIYTAIAADLDGEQEAAERAGILAEGESYTGHLTIEPQADRATFAMASNHGELDLVLTSPDGQRLDRHSAELNPRFHLIEGPNFEYFQVKDPAAGQWSFEVRAREGVGTFEAFHFSTTVASPIVASLESSRWLYEPGEPIQLRLSLRDASIPITDADLRVKVTPPDEAPYIVAAGTLHDDGEHRDGTAGDGVYAAEFLASQTPGVYEFELEVAGRTANHFPFTRSPEITIAVADALEDQPDARRVDPGSAFTLDFGWQNRELPTDVNGDGVISSFDVLRINNRLNSIGAGALPRYGGWEAQVDVNNDGFSTHMDALVVINSINRSQQAVVEGEGSRPNSAPNWPAPFLPKTIALEQLFGQMAEPQASRPPAEGAIHWPALSQLAAPPEAIRNVPMDQEDSDSDLETWLNDMADEIDLRWGFDQWSG